MQVNLEEQQDYDIQDRGVFCCTLLVRGSMGSRPKLPIGIRFGIAQRRGYCGYVRVVQQEVRSRGAG